MIFRAAIASLLLLPCLAAADSARLIGKYGDWESFTYAEKAGKVCYIASKPKKSLGAPKTRGTAYLTITHRTADHSVGVVSIAQGIAYRKYATPSLEVGGARFDLYVSGDTVWARNDKAVVAAFGKAKGFSVTGMPLKGEVLVDQYSLDGFAKALGDINKACGN